MMLCRARQLSLPRQIHACCDSPSSTYVVRTLTPHRKINDVSLFGGGTSSNPSSGVYASMASLTATGIRIVPVCVGNAERENDCKFHFFEIWISFLHDFYQSKRLKSSFSKATFLLGGVVAGFRIKTADLSDLNGTAPK